MPNRTAIRVCTLATQATLAAAEPAGLDEEPTDSMASCPGLGTQVVVRAHRFGDGRSYAFVVTNDAASPIVGFSVGLGSVNRAGDTFIETSFATKPVSVGAPSGWTGMHVATPDPRRPGSHAPTLTRYLWSPEDLDTRIPPGRSLSGFSVQLPTPQESVLAYQHFWESHGFPAELPKDPPLEERLPAQPDLTTVQFGAFLSGKACVVVGDVQLDQAPMSGGHQP